MKDRAFVIVAFLFSIISNGQLSSPTVNIENQYKSSMGGGVSYGYNMNRNAQFWGFAIDYSTLIKGRFVFITSLTFDQEIEELKNNDVAIVNTFNIVAGISYLLTNRISVTTGFGKGFLHDGNDSKKMIVTNGDLGTGLVFGYLFPNLFSNKRYVLSLSTSFEYNITQEEYTNSFDFGVGYSF